MLYPDGHVTFSTKPTAGVDTDNIYTKMRNRSLDVDEFRPHLQYGKPPHAAELVYPGHNSLGDGIHASTDSLIWP